MLGVSAERSMVSIASSREILLRPRSPISQRFYWVVEAIGWLANLFGAVSGVGGSDFCVASHLAISIEPLQGCNKAEDPNFISFCH